jgi:hypothetical protein
MFYYFGGSGHPTYFQGKDTDGSVFEQSAGESIHLNQKAKKWQDEE